MKKGSREICIAVDEKQQKNYHLKKEGEKKGFDSLKLQLWDADGEEVSVKDNQVVLTFSLTNPGDLALGKTLYFSFSENEYRSGYATFYMPILERENLEMEDGVTGTRAVTDTSILPAGTKLRAEVILNRMLG